MSSINFDELDNEVSNKVEEEKKQLNIKMQQQTQEKRFFSTEGWTKGPFIVGGVIAAALIVVSLYIVFIM